jgi:hypothetical protein
MEARAAEQVAAETAMARNQRMSKDFFMERTPRKLEPRTHQSMATNGCGNM